MKIFLSVLAGILILLAVPWAIQGSDFFLYRAFAPAREDVRRDVFEHSKAYRQGTVQELENLHVEYLKAGPDHRIALRSIILRRAADFPEDAMPRDLAGFIRSIK